MKKSTKKLRLDRENIRLLSGAQLGAAAGGLPNTGGPSQDGCGTLDCETDTNRCPHPRPTYTCTC